MLPVRSALVLSLLSLLCACKAKPSSAGTASGRPPLGLSALGADAGAKTGPVQVSYFAPRGETEGQVEVSVSFDRPMVALGAQTDAPQDALSIKPQVEGRVRWVGSQTLLFEPSTPLPMATEFEVRVPRALRALDGSELAEELAFRFATPAPEVVHTDPRSGVGSEPRERPIELLLNQRVSLAQLQTFVGLTYVTPNKALPTAMAFRIERPDPSDEQRVRIVPNKPYPLAAHVTLRLRAGLPSAEGPRSLVKDFETSFTVYGPLRLLANAPCKPAECVPRVHFSNQVSVAAARAALRFDPPLAKPLSVDEDYTSDELYFGDELAPNTSYRVSIEGALRDIYGTALEGSRVVTVRTPPFPALARFLIEGDLHVMNESAAVPPVRMQLQNLKDARLELSALTFDEVAPSELALIRPKAPALVSVLGAAGPTERRVADGDASSLLAHGKGIVLARLSAHGQGQPHDEQRLLAFTDLAPTLKAGSKSGMVWVTRFSDALPVPEASVRIVRGLQTVATGQTDAEGMFSFVLPPAGAEGEQQNDDLSAVVQKGDDLSFARKFAGVGPWELTSRASYEAEGETSAHLFTERGVYRPGDTLQLKGILRTQDGKGMKPASGHLTYRVVDASESEVEHGSSQLTAYGSFVQSVRIPGSVELGPLSLQVTFGGQHFSTSAEVAEYRPAELELSLRADRELAVRGERASAQLEGKYLFGAPAKHARVFWNAGFVSRSFEAPQHAGFSFEDEDDGGRDQDNGYVGSGEGELDERGQLKLELSLKNALLSGPSTLTVETSVLLNNTQTASRTTVDVTPASVVAGIRAASSVSEAQKPLLLEFAALTPRGVAKPDVVLEASLARRVYTVEVVNGVREHKAHDEPVGSCKQLSGVEPVRCSITPPLPGLHVARVRTKDGKGRLSTASRWVYVYGAGQASWGEDAGYLLSLKADRSAYKLGETAKLLVPSPFAEAEALVTVERDGVLSAERHKLGPAGTLEIRIDERFVPNAFVSVLLVRPLGKPGDGVDYRIGVLELSADVSSRKLAVEVKPDALEKRPGEEVALQLSVRDGAGQPTQAELTVFAVDEGVLSLTGYRTPDPFAAIYAPRSLAVWTSDARASVARVLEGPGDDKGGDEGGGGGGELVRRDFSAVALYLPHVETDKQGKASLRFKLPDSTTRYRIMAVAASRGAEVGAGEATVRTKKPLMLRPQLPRLLRAGDALSAGVVVHNETAQALDVELSLEARELSLEGAAKQQVHVPAQGQVEARYALRANKVGEVQLNFSASAGKERDAITLTRSVLSPSVPETVLLAGVTEQAAREQLAALRGVRGDVGGLALTLSASALLELEQPARTLLAYPYGCTEQLSSRLIALAALEQLRKPLALSDASFAPEAAGLSSELERHQRADGGFGLWSASDSATPALSAYLTGYALLAFEQLKVAKLAVSPHAFERAKLYLASSLRSAPGADAGGARGSLEERAFTVYALARSGAYEPGYAGKLFEQRAELSPLAQLELAAALQHDPARKGNVETLLSELSSHVRVTASEAHLETNAGDGHARQFVSDVRATSELTLLLLAHAPEHVLLPKLSRWLSASRARDGAWPSTQETAWGVMALAGYLQTKEAVTPDMQAQVLLGERKLGPVALSGRRAQSSFQVPMREVPTAGAAVVFDKQGAGTLHYALALTYAASELPKLPSERGFYVERSYERIEPGALARGDATGQPADSAKVGDYVRVTLRVAVPSARSFVVISDPLPAGLEAVDFTLATEMQGAARALTFSAPLDHQELRDDRAVFAVNELPPGLYRYSYLARASSRGTFVVPPAKVEEMYHPETQGLTAAQSFRVEGL